MVAQNLNRYRSPGRLFTMNQPDQKTNSLARQSSIGVTMRFLKLAVTAALFVAGPTWAQSLTAPQNNAVRSAKDYLHVSGFSRSGLIHQLSSDVGEGYDIADATVAVDSLNIDWNSEAVRSAKDYLHISGFSCKGLINQLSSSAGDGYTVSQATYGAQQAGVCQ
jgi:hypothetical protein